MSKNSVWMDFHHLPLIRRALPRRCALHSLFLIADLFRLKNWGRKGGGPAFGHQPKRDAPRLATSGTCGGAMPRVWPPLERVMEIY